MGRRREGSCASPGSSPCSEALPVITSEGDMGSQRGTHGSLIESWQ